MISQTNQVAKAICQVLIEITHHEKTKAINSGEYGDAVAATIFEEIFKHAELHFS